MVQNVVATSFYIVTPITIGRVLLNGVGIIHIDALTIVVIGRILHDDITVTRSYAITTVVVGDIVLDDAAVVHLDAVEIIIKSAHLFDLARTGGTEVDPIEAVGDGPVDDDNPLQRIASVRNTVPRGIVALNPVAIQVDGDVIGLDHQAIITRGQVANKPVGTWFVDGFATADALAEKSRLAW